MVKNFLKKVAKWLTDYNTARAEIYAKRGLWL
jgi:hypothetical protein